MKKILYNWLTDEEQKIILFLIIFGLIGLLVQYTGLIADVNPEAADSLKAAVEEDYEIVFDLKTATKAELITIPGIGEKRAADIIQYRDEHGFASLTEIKNIRGIGDATFARLETYFIPFGETTEDSTPSENIEPTQPPPKTVSDSRQSQTDKININTASLTELQKITGVGPATAERIIVLRNELGEFTSFEQLLLVRGIGPKTLERMLPEIEL